MLFRSGRINEQDIIYIGTMSISLVIQFCYFVYVMYSKGNEPQPPLTLFVISGHTHQETSCIESLPSEYTTAVIALNVD